MTFEWEVSPELALEQLTDAYINQIRWAVHELLMSYAPRIEAWMKQNAGWQDRTGNARAGLYTEVQALSQDVFELILDHSMDYGWWLETRKAGKYAIIAPAVDVFSQQIFADIAALFK